MIVKNIRKQIDGNTIFDNISFSLNTQDKVGLVGVNGSGKSTLLKVLGGIITTDNGVIDLDGDSIGYLYQEIPIKYNDYTIEKYIKEIECWKSNIRGVDLNLNYPAGWQNAVKNKAKKGITMPGPRDYPGPNPLSEIETKNMVNFTKLFNFDMTISLHSQGKEIYWNYLNYKIDNAYEIGKKFEKVSGYLLTKPDYYSSFAGYKDWFIENFRKPGYTIEIGKGEEGRPLPLENADKIYEEVEEILLKAIEECSNI